MVIRCTHTLNTAFLVMPCWKSASHVLMEAVEVLPRSPSCRHSFEPIPRRRVHGYIRRGEGYVDFSLNLGMRTTYIM